MTEVPRANPLREAVNQVMDEAFVSVEKNFNGILSDGEPVLATCDGREDLIRTLYISLGRSGADATTLRRWLTVAIVQRRELAAELELIKMAKGES